MSKASNYIQFSLDRSIHLSYKFLYCSIVWSAVEQIIRLQECEVFSALINECYGCPPKNLNFCVAISIFRLLFLFLFVLHIPVLIQALPRERAAKGLVLCRFQVEFVMLWRYIWAWRCSWVLKLETMDWGFVTKTWDKWAASNVGSSG